MLQTNQPPVDVRGCEDRVFPKNFVFGHVHLRPSPIASIYSWPGKRNVCQPIRHDATCLYLRLACKLQSLASLSRSLTLSLPPSLSLSLSLSLSPSPSLSLSWFLFLHVVRHPGKGERALCVPMHTETTDTTGKQAVETVRVINQLRKIRTLFQEEDTLHYKSDTIKATIQTLHTAEVRICSNYLKVRSLQLGWKHK